MSSKEIGVAVAAPAIGVLLAARLFAMLFNASIGAVIPDVLALAVLMSAGAFAAGFIDCLHWRRAAILLAAPPVLMCCLILAMLHVEQRRAAEWAIFPAVTILLCLLGSRAGKMVALKRAAPNATR